MLNSYYFKLYFILILVCLAIQLQGQIDNEKGYGIYVGLTNTQIKDKVLNSIKHHGSMLSIGYSRQKNKESVHLNFDFNLNPNFLKSRYENSKGTISLNNLISYSCLFKTKQIHQNIFIYTGTGISLNSIICYFDHWDDSHLYWHTKYSLAIKGAGHYNLKNGSSLNLNIGLPVVNLISRPPQYFPYKVLNPKFIWIVKELHSNSTITSFKRHVGLDLTLAYHISGDGKRGKSLFYDLHFSDTDLKDSKPFTLLTQSLGIQLKF